MNNNMLRRIYVVFITVVAILISSSRAFILTTTTTTTTTTTLHRSSRRQHLSSSLLFASPGGRSSSSGIDNYIETANIKTSNRQRMTISGVSVSNGKGFWVMLKKASSSSTEQQQEQENNNDKNYILSIKVTNNADDSFAATSAESLTLIQLISNVDMAGAVLPPELLSNMILSYCDDSDDEEDDEKECEFILQKDDVVRSVKKGVVVDQVRLQITDNNGSNDYKWILDCTLPDMEDDRISFTPSWDILNDVCYRDNYENYDYSSSLAFISIALALRYKAPIVLETTTTTKDDSIDDDISLSLLSSTNSIMVFDNTDNNNEQFQKQFPNYATSSKLQNQSMRVEQKITQSYKIHQLTNALRIATERNDVKACMKIQKELDMYDNFDELPVIGNNNNNDSDSNNQDSSSLNQMQ